MNITKYTPGFENGKGLKIIECIRNETRLIKFKCECLHCGNHTTIRRSKILLTKSCGCIKRVVGKESPHFKGYGEIHLGKWNTYIRNARARNIEFSITIEEAWEIYKKQYGKCAISGLPIEFWFDAKSRNATASLDRKNNTLGYTKDNVWWVHKKVNQIKMDMEISDFIDLCKIITTNMEK